MNSFNDDLQAELDALHQAGLSRALHPVHGPLGPTVEMAISGESPRTFINFSSNDYLGLASHPALREAAAQAARNWGAGSGASRLICGSLAPHHQLEAALAAFKNTPAALTFSTGYATALGTIPALVGAEDIVILDKLVHACCVDGARLSGATMRVYRHNDLADLESKLQWADARRQNARGRRILLITESVFSMDGDLAPLRNIVELKERYGAWLMVDEAHATGLYGEFRRGLVEEFQLADQVEVQMGTLGKAFGAAGGYIAGARPLIDLLIHRARSFLFSTAPVPAQSAAALAALELIQSDEGETLRQRCWANVDTIKKRVIEAGWSLPPTQSAILPLMIGNENEAVTIARALRNEGLLVPAIRFPTVARGQARLRLTASASHAAAEIAALAAGLSRVQRPPGAVPS
jgi:8-amino-7-oxononanoate synthase